MADTPFGRGAPLPAAAGPRRYPLWWVREGDPPCDYTCLSEDWWGCYVHWCPADADYPRGRSRLCIEDVESCPWHVYPREWAGYLDVWSHRERRPGGLSITPALGRSLADLGRGPGGLYALRITVRHTGRTAGGGVVAVISETPRQPGEPRRIDLQPTLQRIWGLSVRPDMLLIPTGRRETIPFPEPAVDDRYGLGEAKGGIR